MAVDLPPALPPQQIEVQQISQGNAVASAPFRQYQMHVFGKVLLAPEALSRIVGDQADLPAALDALTRAFYSAGYPGTQLSYGILGHDIYVLVVLTGVSETSVESPFTAYFAGLSGTRPLKDTDLEPRRVLADMHADRAGLQVSTTLQPDGQGNARLDLSSQFAKHPNELFFEYGNPGNRYVARNLVDAGFKTGSRYGDEVRIGTRTSIDEFNRDGRYNEQQLQWSRVTPWGVFGAGGQHLEYDITETLFNGKLTVGDVYWLYPLYADFSTRWTTQVKIDRTNKKGEAFAIGPLPQNESYTSAELATASLGTFVWLDSRWDLDVTVAIRKGLSDGALPDNGRELDYLLVRPAGRLKVYGGNYWTTALEFSAQFSEDIVPEQQQWVLGGIGNLYAQLPGVAVGDEGMLLRSVTELGRYELFDLSLRPRVFLESGSAKSNGITGTQSLSDVGVELGVRVYDWLEGALAYAERIDSKNIDRETLERTEANLYFRLQARF